MGDKHRKPPEGTSDPDSLRLGGTVRGEHFERRRKVTGRVPPSKQKGSHHTTQHREGARLGHQSSQTKWRRLLTVVLAVFVLVLVSLGDGEQPAADLEEIVHQAVSRRPVFVTLPEDIQ